MYIAIFPNADWTLVVFLTMLGMNNKIIYVCLIWSLVKINSFLIFSGKSTTGVANAMIPAFTSFQYPPTLRTRAMGMTNFSAGFALISVPYIWLLVSIQIVLQWIWTFFFFNKNDNLNSQKYIVNYLPPLLLGSCGLIGALVLFFIDDRTAIILAAERKPQSKHRDSQQHLGK